MALLILTKAPLWSWRSLRSLKILTDLGSSLLIPLILMTKATLGWAGTKICPVNLAFLLAVISSAVDCWWAAAYCWTRASNACLLVLFSALLFYLNYLRDVAILWFLSSFFLRPSGFGGTFLSAYITPQSLYL